MKLLINSDRIKHMKTYISTERSIKVKFKWLFLSIIMMTVLAGCTEYSKAMDNGEEAIKNEDYVGAVTYYEEAVENKSKKEEPASYLFQVKNMQTGLTDFDNGDFEDAKAHFNDILEEDDEYLILENEANTQLDKIEEQKDLADELDHTYAKAADKKDEENYQDALNVIEETFKKDLSHDSIRDKKDELKALKEDVEEDKSKKDKVQETLDKAKTNIEHGKYGHAKDLVENHELGEYMDEEESEQFAQLSQQIEDQIPSLSAKEIKSGKHDGDYVKMGGPIRETYDIHGLEGFRLEISENAQKPSEDEWRDFQGTIDVLFEDSFDPGELEGISIHDEIYFYGYVRGEIETNDRYGREYTTGAVNLEEVDEVIVD